MEREILFRGKGTFYGGWHYGSFIETDDCVGNPFRTSRPKKKYHICEFFDGDWNMSQWANIEVDPETVGQFTGLCDKNGKKIFEGDIIKAVNREHSISNNPVVVWGSKSHGWSLKCDIDNYFIKVKYYKLSSSDEVIGNIYDNPDLLKESTNKTTSNRDLTGDLNRIFPHKDLNEDDMGLY